MTTRYCLLGNSHIAALKRGWDVIAGEFPDVKTTMFAAGGDHFAAIVAKDGALEATTDELRERLRNRSDGQERIVFNDYDVFVVAGLGFDIAFVARYYETHPTYLNANGKTDIVSIDVLAEMLLQDLRDSLSYKLAKLVATSCDKPVYICWAPLKRREMLNIPRHAMIAAAFEKIAERDERAYVHAVMDRVAAILRREKLYLIKQPEETMDAGIFTKEELSKAATLPPTAANQVARMDIGHMNQDFGRYMMRQIMAVTRQKMSVAA